MSARRRHADAAPRPVRTRVPREVRFAVFERDRYRCRICGDRPGPDCRVALEIDHIVPVAKGGGSEMENLQTVCALCNRGKGALDLRGVGAGRGGSRTAPTGIAPGKALLQVRPE